MYELAELMAALRYHFNKLLFRISAFQAYYIYCVDPGVLLSSVTLFRHCPCLHFVL